MVFRADLAWVVLCVPCIVPPGARAEPAGVPFDLQGFIDGRLQAGEKRIVIPPGQYRVTPRDRQHLVLRDLKDVQIIADGVEMICTETTRAVTITRCTNVTLRGLVIDYDTLPFTQGRIVGFSADGKIHEIELFDGYLRAESARNFKYEIFRPDTRTLRCDDRYPLQVEVAGPNRLRIHIPGGRAGDPEQVGDLIVIGTEHVSRGSAPHAVECSRNVNVRLEEITLYASNCFGFIETDCDGSVYYCCRIDRRLVAGDIVKRADPRLRSLDADAFHSKRAVKGPAYIECAARFMGDDAININGEYHMIMAVKGRVLRVLAKHGMDIAPGDPVELVSYTGERLPDAKADASGGVDGASAGGGDQLRTVIEVLIPSRLVGVAGFADGTAGGMPDVMHRHGLLALIERKDDAVGFEHLLPQFDAQEVALPRPAISRE